jgi:hypothetical protein
LRIDLDTSVVATDIAAAAAVVFDTLQDLGLDRMTPGKVEFVMCASALTAQV